MSLISYSLEQFRDPEISDYIVWYCRMLIAGHLKTHQNDFIGFVDAMYPGEDNKSLFFGGGVNMEPIFYLFIYLMCLTLIAIPHLFSISIYDNNNYKKKKFVPRV